MLYTFLKRILTLKGIALHLKFQIAWHPYLHFGWVKPIVAFLGKLWFDTVGFFLKMVDTHVQDRMGWWKAELLNTYLRKKNF